MTRKNKKARANAPLAQPTVVGEWGMYMGRGGLEDWQRLMKDLGFEEEFPSKTQCRKALKTVWVNIRDFLDAVETGRPVHHFKNQYQLAAYTRKMQRFYPKKNIEKGSPLRQLLAQVKLNQGGRGHDYSGLVGKMGGLSIQERNI
ncbi:hypothetical protein E0Z10_g9918 [Xylaria hypoxylon]|uniref:Uncharacterized protein n=1 Tax=Xylaria hypoxylon TaxID=37992 RepID=A0A4Z0Y7C4_9PEZI|nr:hypothetical protein E0Z10_g9918 [Xylaria hypoxylon]